MARILAFLIALQLMGCVHSPFKTTVKAETVIVQREESPTVAYQLPSPPDPAHYELRRDVGLFEYTAAMNLYLVRVYNYTRTLNRYSESKGWLPTGLEALCADVEYPPLGKFPDISISSGARGKKDVEAALAEYIRLIRTLYDDQTHDVEEWEKLRRKLCSF